MQTKNSFNIDGSFRKKKISYTPISNPALDDETLSMKGAGLYSRIQRYITIPEFTLYKSFLQKKFPDGIRSFNTCWNELKEKGYLKQYRIRTEKGFRYEYELLDEPDLDTPATVNIRMDGTIVDNTSENQETFDDIIPDNKPCLDIEVEDEYEIKSQINYSKLKNEPFIDEIVDTILEINDSKEIVTTVNNEPIPTHRLRAAFKKLDSRIIKEIIERLKTYNKPIINIKSFLITVLYNAVSPDYSTGTDPP